ncbi:MAG: hypothetical protein RLZZ70_126 [Candidatus Parcubacteria bacterium]|jgi:ribonuclease HI
METIKCFTYGLATSDPGPAAVAVVICDSTGAVLHEASRQIGNSTNVYAAYQAVLLGLESLEQVFGDTTKTISFTVQLSHSEAEAQLAHRQVIQNPGLIPLFMAIHNVRVEHFPQLNYELVTKEKNAIAKTLATKALDD